MGGRSIRLFLVDGTPGGLRTAEFGLSTIKGVYVPRGALQAFANRSEAKKTGIYVLLGDDPEVPARTKIYIGEADEVLARLVAHDKDPDKDFWDRSVVFVTKDQNLTKAHVRHLEAKLIDLAIRAKRCTVDNKTDPYGGILPEADLAEMEEFVEQVRLLPATMGVDAFDQPVSTAGPFPMTEAVGSTPTLLMLGDGYDAKCSMVDGVFVVQKGSRARSGEAPSLSESSKAKRRELLSSGVFQPSNNGLLFTQDYAFGSASGAAQVVCGANVNGKNAWRIEDGVTFAEWQEKKFSTASSSGS